VFTEDADGKETCNWIASNTVELPSNEQPTKGKQRQTMNARPQTNTDELEEKILAMYGNMYGKGRKAQ
jgi:hypothetical protein